MRSDHTLDGTLVKEEVEFWYELELELEFLCLFEEICHLLYQ